MDKKNPQSHFVVMFTDRETDRAEHSRLAQRSTAMSAGG
jgi:hypothetical protein